MQKFDLKTLPKPTLKQLLPILAVLLTIGAAAFYILPTFSKFQENQKAIAQEKDQIALLAKKLNDLQSINETEAEQSLTEARAALPESKNIPGLIAGLQRLMVENNLEIVGLQLKPGKIASDSAYQETTMKVSVQGDLKGIDGMLKKLTEVRRILGVQKIAGASASVGNQLLATLDMTFYTQPLPTVQYDNALPLLDSSKKDLLAKLARYPIYTESSLGTIIQVSPIASASASGKPSPTPSASPTKTASPSAFVR